MLTSRMGHYITEVPTQELLSVPVPKGPVDLSTLKSFADIDASVRWLFALSQAEWVLVEDMLESGRTMCHARDALTERGARVWTATLLHRGNSVLDPDFSAGVTDVEYYLPWDRPLVSSRG